MTTDMPQSREDKNRQTRPGAAPSAFNFPKIIPPVLIVALGVLAYWNSFQGTFIFDDHVKIVERRLIRSPLPLLHFLSGTQRPVVDLTFALNYAFTGLDVAGYHAVNLAIHIISSLLLYGIVKRTLLLPLYNGRFDPAAPWLAFVSAAAWISHPLATSAVTYICQRYEIMMAMFYLMTLYCVIRGAVSGMGTFWRAVAVAACALGMGCKEVMITAPVAVLLYDWIFFPGGSLPERLRKHLGLYAGLAACWLILIGLMRVKLAARESAFYDWEGISAWSYAATQFGVLCRYLRLAFWPRGLCFDYGWDVAEKAGDILPAGIIVAALAALSAIAVYRRRGWAFPAACFFVILAPTSSFVARPDAIAEYRAYLPLAAVITPAVLGAHGFAEYLARRFSKIGIWPRTACIVLLAAALTSLAIGAAQRNKVYHSSESVWRDVIAKRPGNMRAYLNLTGALLDQRRFPEAVESASTLLERLPDFSVVGAAEIPPQVRRAADIERYRDARYYAHAHNYLGVAYAGQGLKNEAAAHFAEALRLLPQFAAARANLALALDAP